MSEHASNENLNNPQLPEAEDPAAIKKRQEAFDRIYKEYYPKVVGFLIRGSLSIRPVEAEDIAQTTFLRAWSNFSRYDQTRPVKNWLFTIAKNAAFNHMRTRRRKPVTYVGDEEHIIDSESHTPTPEEQYLVNETLGEHLKGISLLNEDYRESLVHRVNGKTIKEIAEETGRSEGSEKLRIFRARKQVTGYVESRMGPPPQDEVTKSVDEDRWAA